MPELQRTSSDGNALVPASHGVAAPGPVYEDALDLGWYLRALGRRWAWLVGGALLAAVAAAGFAASQPRHYEASTTLMVTAPSRVAAAPVNPQTYRAILENGSLAAQVVEELRLADPPHRLTPQAFLREALTVEAVPNTNVVRMRVRLRDPQLAADASRRLSHKAIALTRQLNQQEGSSVQELLREHLSGAAERMAAAEKALLDYQQTAQVDLLKEDAQAMLDERGDLLKLVVAIESEKARLATAEREIQRQERVLTTPRLVAAEEALRAEMQVSAPDTPPVAATGRVSEKEQDTAAQSDALDLSNPFINPVYQTLDFQIATSRARLAALEQQRRQLVDVRKLGGQAVAQLGELYSRQIELARLQNNYDLAKRVHSDLVVRYEESRTQVLGGAPLLQMVDEALPPDRPLSRRLVQLTALGFAAGLVGFGLLVLAWEGR